MSDKRDNAPSEHTPRPEPPRVDRLIPDDRNIIKTVPDGPPLGGGAPVSPPPPPRKKK